jgi:hypothetical protein
MVVDYNELRVIPPLELAEVIGPDYPDARLKCEDISRSLNRIFAERHVVSLDHVKEMSRKDAREALGGIDGLEPYSAARIQLLGLQQHAIPLDSAMWAYARQTEIVDPKCPLEEAEAFLERRIADSDALEFFALFRQQAWAECGDAVAAGEVETIHSVPPDRTTRNMLQALSSTADRPVLSDDALDSAADGGEAAQGDGERKAGTTRRKRTTRSARPAKAKKAQKKTAPKTGAKKSRTKPAKAKKSPPKRSAKPKAGKRSAGKTKRSAPKKKTRRKTTSKSA